MCWDHRSWSESKWGQSLSAILAILGCCNCHRNYLVSSPWYPVKLFPCNPSSRPFPIWESMSVPTSVTAFHRRGSHWPFSAITFDKVNRLTQIEEEVGCYSCSPEPSRLDHTYKCLSISRSYPNKWTISTAWRRNMRNMDWNKILSLCLDSGRFPGVFSFKHKPPTTPLHPSTKAKPKENQYTPIVSPYSHPWLKEMSFRGITIKPRLVVNVAKSHHWK